MAMINHSSSVFCFVKKLKTYKSDGRNEQYDLWFRKNVWIVKLDVRKRGDAMFLRVISTGSKPGNCYALVSDSGQILLLDFGCEKKKILMGIDYRISDVVGAVLSHGHG